MRFWREAPNSAHVGALNASFALSEHRLMLFSLTRTSSARSHPHTSPAERPKRAPPARSAGERARRSAQFALILSANPSSVCSHPFDRYVPVLSLPLSSFSPFFLLPVVLPLGFLKIGEADFLRGGGVLSFPPKIFHP